MTNTPSELKVACVQLTSGIDLEYNRQQVEVALQEAFENGAQWIVLPEAVNPVSYTHLTLPTILLV